jgi:hypothetical protein
VEAISVKFVESSFDDFSSRVFRCSIYSRPH